MTLEGPRLRVRGRFGRGCLLGGEPGKRCWWDEGTEELTWKDGALRSGA